MKVIKTHWKDLLMRDRLITQCLKPGRMFVYKVDAVPTLGLF